MKLSLLKKVLFCAVVSILLSITSSQAQCPGNVPPQTITYDTTVTGGGNGLYVFTFPQLDPNVGTNYAVNFETIITLKYSFELENNILSNSTTEVIIGRSDKITYPTGSLIRQTPSVLLGEYELGGSDGITGSGPDYLAEGPLFPFEDFSSKYQLTNNLATFLGNGTVAIKYQAISPYTVTNSNISLRPESADTILFKITYSYCQTSSLPADMNSFKVIKLPTGKVELSWFSPNELAGNKYEVQKSADARTFTGFHSITATQNKGTNYKVNYSPSTSDKNIMFFRIKEYNANGQPKYSPIKSVMLDREKGEEIKVFPTVARSFIRINFPVADKDNWQVNIVALSGQVVQQSRVKNSAFATVAFNSNVKPGFYIVETKNERTLESQRTKILIQ